MIIALMSASGSPGVTTTAIGLACTWPHPVVCVDADGVGGSSILAGYYRGFVAPSVTVVDLLLSYRAGTLANDVDRACLPLAEGAWVLPGPRSHKQAASVRDLWEPLAIELRSREDTDVIVDLGRLGMTSFADPWLSIADVVGIVMRSDLPAVAATRQWASHFSEEMHMHPELGPRGLVVIAPGQPYSASEITKALGLPVFAQVNRDSRSPGIYSRGAQAKPSQKYRKDLHACGESLRQAAMTQSGVITSP